MAYNITTRKIDIAQQIQLHGRNFMAEFEALRLLLVRVQKLGVAYTDADFVGTALEGLTAAALNNAIGSINQINTLMTNGVPVQGDHLGNLEAIR